MIGTCACAKRIRNRCAHGVPVPADVACAEILNEPALTVASARETAGVDGPPTDIDRGKIDTMDTWLSDLGHGARMLRKYPAIYVLAIVTLGSP